jgi:hypothetical protein
MLDLCRVSKSSSFRLERKAELSDQFQNPLTPSHKQAQHQIQRTVFYSSSNNLLSGSSVISLTGSFSSSCSLFRTGFFRTVLIRNLRFKTMSNIVIVSASAPTTMPIMVEFWRPRWLQSGLVDDEELCGHCKVVDGVVDVAGAAGTDVLDPVDVDDGEEFDPVDKVNDDNVDNVDADDVDADDVVVTAGTFR